MSHTHSKCFKHANSFNPHNVSLRKIGLLFSFYILGNRGIDL